MPLLTELENIFLGRSSTKMALLTELGRGGSKAKAEMGREAGMMKGWGLGSGGWGLSGGSAKTEGRRQRSERKGWGRAVPAPVAESAKIIQQDALTKRICGAMVRVRHWHWPWRKGPMAGGWRGSSEVL